MGDPDSFAKLCAGLICTGIWLVLGGAAGWLAHLRMRSVERSLGARAEPAHEGRYLWYAGAASVWLAAAVLAVTGLVSRKWTRTGRDAAFILVGHFTIVTVGSILIAPSGHVASTTESLLPILVFACVVAGGGLTIAPVFGFLWAGARARRLEALPHDGPPPGLERWAIYFGSILVWPVGMIAAAVYGKPQNVRVGTTALRLSLAQLWVVAVATCVGLPVLVGLYG